MVVEDVVSGVVRSEMNVLVGLAISEVEYTKYTALVLLYMCVLYSTHTHTHTHTNLSTKLVF